MRTLMYIGLSLLTVLVFVVLAEYSRIYQWPLWLSGLVFLLALIGLTVALSYAFVKLRPGRGMNSNHDK